MLLPKLPILNRVLLALAAAAALFAFLAYVVPIQPLIWVLNGIFAGCVFAIIVAYWKLFWFALLGVYPYDRVRQMTLGFFLCWLAYCIGVAISIVLRARGIEVVDTLAVAASRYIAIAAAVLQVTAPDFGLGIFHGRDRKTLWTGVTVGTLAAVIAIFAQATEAISTP